MLRKIKSFKILLVDAKIFAVILHGNAGSGRNTGPDLSDNKLPEKSAGNFLQNPVLRGDFCKKFLSCRRRSKGYPKNFICSLRITKRLRQQSLSERRSRQRSPTHEKVASAILE
jgi:hypothetical protein